MSAIRGATGLVLPNTTLRLTIARDMLEWAATGFASFGDRITTWADSLASSNAGVYRVTLPLVQDGRATLTVKTSGAGGTRSPNAVADAIERTLPLGADLAELWISPPSPRADLPGALDEGPRPGANSMLWPALALGGAALLALSRPRRRR